MVSALIAGRARRSHTSDFDVAMADDVSVDVRWDAEVEQGRRNERGDRVQRVIR
jgi:hypothetical protein